MHLVIGLTPFSQPPKDFKTHQGLIAVLNMETLFWDTLYIHLVRVTALYLIFGSDRSPRRGDLVHASVRVSFSSNNEF